MYYGDGPASGWRGIQLGLRGGADDLTGQDDTTGKRLPARRVCEGRRSRGLDAVPRGSMGNKGEGAAGVSGEEAMCE